MANVDLVREMLETFNRGGIESALAYVDPDVEWRGPPEWLEQHCYKGHDGLRKLSADWGELFDEYELALDRVIDLGDDHVVVLIHQRGRVKDQGGSVVEQRIGYDWQLRDGRLLRAKVYFSWEETLRAAGVPAGS